MDVDLLIKQGIVEKDCALKYGVKILGDGDVKKKLKILVPISKKAVKKIEKAGGKVIVDSKSKKKISKKDN